MEQLTGLLLPGGNVTLTVVGLFLLTLLLTGVYQLGIYLVRLLIALDDENAPDIKMENVFNKLTNKIFKIVPLYESKVRKYKGGYYVATTIWSGNRAYSVSGTKTWYSLWGVKEHCLHQNKEDALSLAKKKYPNGVGIVFGWKLMFNILVFTICVDLLLFSLSLAFFPTIIISGMGIFVWGMRTLAKKVYKNSKNIGKHEERILEIEGKLND